MLRGSISAEAARRNDCLEFSEVEVADRVQCLGSGTVLEVLWQGFQPSGIVTLQRDQLGDSVTPTLGATAVIKWSPYPGCRCPRGPSSTTACLALGIGHRSLADRLAWHSPLRSVTSRNPRSEQARFLKRQLSLPVSTMSQWWVRRSSSAVVIFGSPNTLGHSPKARLVVTTIEVRS